jgi:N-alpha-acetyltransferase 35, NatC auxiliary subunit
LDWTTLIPPDIPAGVLVKEDGFTLFEAVGALEVSVARCNYGSSDSAQIGDPKMDSGAPEAGEDLEDDFDVAQSLTAENAIWIIDELLRREVSWHEGYPLSQTLFTSVYLDKLLWPEPKELQQAHFIRSDEPDSGPTVTQDLLRAYCLGLVKCCDLALSMVTSQHYYEV